LAKTLTLGAWAAALAAPAPDAGAIPGVESFAAADAAALPAVGDADVDVEGRISRAQMFHAHDVFHVPPKVVDPGVPVRDLASQQSITQTSVVSLNVLST
jgi:hypothetical protein